MTDAQYADAIRKTMANVLYELLDEIETEYDPETIKARIKAKIKEVSSTS